MGHWEAVRRSWDNSRRIALRRVHEYLCGHSTKRKRVSVNISSRWLQTTQINLNQSQRRHKLGLTNYRIAVAKYHASLRPACHAVTRSVQSRLDSGMLLPRTYRVLWVLSRQGKLLQMKCPQPPTLSHQIINPYTQTRLFHSGLQDLA